MEAVFGLMLMLIQVSCGAVTSCDGRQDGARCSGALGGTVDIRLMDNVSEIYRFIWKNGRTIIFLWRRNKIVVNIIKNRAFFIPSNGTFRLSNLSRTDSGEYELFMYDPSGRFTGQRTLQLFVQAPVSSVQLVPQCLSQGQMMVSCSSEGGDSPQYSWTLDGHTLTDSELLSGHNDTNIIVLRQNIRGRLICSVRNNVSNLSRDTQISTCGFIFINCSSNGTHISEWVFEDNNSLCVDPAATFTKGPHSTVEQWPLMVGVLSALVFFLAVSSSVICARRKQQTNTVEEDDQELTYSEVRVVQQRRRVEQHVEEVEYGQVKFSKWRQMIVCAQTFTKAGDLK